MYRRLSSGGAAPSGVKRLDPVNLFMAALYGTTLLPCCEVEMSHAVDPTLLLVARMIVIAIAAAAAILVADHYWPPGPTRRRTKK